MPGEPAETMIGVGALGFGIVLIYAAYKNVSPAGIILSAVRDGKLTTGAGKAVGTAAAQGLQAGADVLTHPTDYAQPPVAASTDPFIPPYVPPHASVST